MKDHDPTDIRKLDSLKARETLRFQREGETEEADIRWLMSSKRGRRIVWRQLERAGVFRLSFNTNSMTMAFNDGMKNEGLRLLAQIHQFTPELYPTMVREANTNERSNADD